MNTDAHTQAFLDAASAGLTGDPEVRREVRAELASHLDAAARVAQAAGFAGDQAAAQALQAMGPAADIAVELVAANRSRLAWRARARLAVQALLAPAAIILALASVIQTLVGEGGQWLPLDMITGVEADSEIKMLKPLGHLLPSRSRPRRLTAAQQLIFSGDKARRGAAARERAIWEAHPTNMVYLNNYLTVAMANLRAFGNSPQAQRVAIEPELALAAEAEPDNARFQYLRAGLLFKESADITVTAPAASNGVAGLALAISNAPMFDRAMQEFLAGAQKPYYRRYAPDMLRERLAMLGEPQTLSGQLYRFSMAAGVLVPDLADARNLGRAACLEAERAAAGHRPDDARALLEGCWKLAVDVHRDAFCLVDVLMGSAIIGIYSNLAPAIYERLGDPAAAAAARRKAALVSRPVAEWKAQRQARVNTPQFRKNEKILANHGSMLAGILNLNFGESLSANDLRPGRLLEYIIAERVVLEVILLTLLAVLAATLAIALRWRLARGGAAAPLLLLPDAGTALRIALAGVILPLAGYYIYTRWLAMGGREFSAIFISPKLILQAVTMVSLVIGLTGFLSADAVRQRCRRLDIAAPPSRLRRPVRIVYVEMMVFAIMGCLLPSEWLAAGNHNVWGQVAITLTRTVAGLLAGLLLAAGLGAVWRHWRGLPDYGLYYGTVARSLAPNLALAIILLSLAGRPFLGREEQDLVRADGITATLQSGGFTPAESRLVQRLKAETLVAIQEVESGNSAGHRISAESSGE